MTKIMTDARRIAHGYVGISRESDPAQILKFDAVFGLTGIDTSFCATGASYSIGKAFLNNAQIPYTADTIVKVMRGQLPAIRTNCLLLDPRCHIMMQDAMRRGTWRKGLSGAQPDDLIMFSWNGDLLTPEHIGFLDAVDGDVIFTTEFNTSDTNNTDGGAVAHKVRAASLVVGHIALR